MRLLGRDFRTLINNVLFSSPTDVGSQSILDANAICSRNSFVLTVLLAHGAITYIFCLRTSFDELLVALWTAEDLRFSLSLIVFLVLFYCFGLQIRIAEAQLQKTPQQDMKPEQLNKLSKLEEWHTELTLLEEQRLKLNKST